MASIPSESSMTELPYEDRVQLAMIAWREAGGALSMRKAARQYAVSKSTLDYRTKGHTSPATRNQNQQRLTPEEESAIVSWILRLQAWGWPPPIEQARQIAVELLLERKDTRPLGVNWTQKFRSRHPEIKAIYSRRQQGDPRLSNDSTAETDHALFYDMFTSEKNRTNLAKET